MNLEAVYLHVIPGQENDFEQAFHEVSVYGSSLKGSMSCSDV
ncbi:hypothetical protein [Marinicrinis lubricantis]|uniref:Uncharacterized protein n=1 Tax=Marinicrinis lubricantis TaxID=2086470 RepID=A0ABW1INE5_9BACL